MSEPSMISVSWPPLALGEAGWRRRLEDLAARAESLIGQTGLGWAARAGRDGIAATPSGT